MVPEKQEARDREPQGASLSAIGLGSHTQGVGDILAEVMTRRLSSGSNPSEPKD
jgi:hypothetical protein